MMRNVNLWSRVFAIVAVCASATSASLVTFDWTVVGDAGNPSDPFNAGDKPGIGSVGYDYRIATTEVTNAQYTEFLNAVDAAGVNPNGLYNNSMGSDVVGGIGFSAGAANGSKYTVKTNMGNKPVIYTSFFDAMRFVNWLENGQGGGGTEDGVYAISDGLTETRAVGAQFFLPSENEWYKAAYYQPAAQGGDADNYWKYPTASNSVPTRATATPVGDIANPGANIANYFSGAVWNGHTGNVTTVGSAGSLSASFYGTFDQGGNVWEFTEEVVFELYRGIRGGSWSGGESLLRSSTRSAGNPSSETDTFGFRIASSIPEPSTLALLAFVTPVLLRRRRGSPPPLR